MVLKKYFLKYDTICVMGHFAQPSPDEGRVGHYTIHSWGGLGNERNINKSQIQFCLFYVRHTR